MDGLSLIATFPLRHPYNLGEHLKKGEAWKKDCTALSNQEEHIVIYTTAGSPMRLSGHSRVGEERMGGESTIWLSVVAAIITDS
jgi:hypothetical protein